MTQWYRKRPGAGLHAKNLKIIGFDSVGEFIHVDDMPGVIDILLGKDRKTVAHCDGDTIMSLLYQESECPYDKELK